MFRNLLSVAAVTLIACSAPPLTAARAFDASPAVVNGASPIVVSPEQLIAPKDTRPYITRKAVARPAPF